MRGYFALLALVLLLLPSSARASDPECTPQNELALRATIAQHVSAIKIGQYRADATLMQSRAQALDELLGTCGDSMRDRLCQADCAYARGSVYLFRATALPLLSATSSGAPSDNLQAQKDLLKAAEAGARLVDDAIQRLPVQLQLNGGTPKPADGAPPPESQTARDGHINDYMRSLAQLNALRAKLLVAAGDIWYRNASVSQVARLNFSVGMALDDTGGLSALPGGEYKNAMTYYDEAFWLVMEARTSVPNDEPLFEPELATLATLESDVKTRLESVQKGYLFIGIDPDDFSLVSADNLARLLLQQKELLEKLEEQIHTKMTEWAEQQKTLDGHEFELATMQHDRSIDNEVYKIAALQASADAVSSGIKSKIDAITENLSKFELDRQIRDVQTDLKRQTMTMQNQITLIQGQKEQDLLSLESQKTRDQMDAYRFSIDMTMAAYNFEMQAASLMVQLDDLRARRKSDMDEKGAFKIRSDQAGVSMRIEQHRIQAADVMIDKNRAAQGTVLASEATAIQSDIAAAKAELAYYTGPGRAAVSQICADKAALFSQQQVDIKKVKGCLDGSGGCPGGANMKQDIDKLYDKESELYKLQKSSAEQTLALVTLRLGELGVAVGAWLASHSAVALAEAASAAAIALDMLPSITITIGITDDSISTDLVTPLQQTAAAVADLAWRNADVIRSDIQFGVQITQEMNQLLQQASALKTALDQTNIDTQIANLNRLKAIAEVSVEAARLDKDWNESRNEMTIQKIECNKELGQFDSTAARLQAEIAALNARLVAKRQEATLLNFDIAQLQQQRAESQLEIKRLELVQGEMLIEQTRCESDRLQTEKMIATVEKQQSRVASYSSTVNSLKQQFNVKAKALADIQERIEKKTIQLADGQVAYVKQAIAEENTASLAQVQALKDAVNEVKARAALIAEVNEIDGALRNAVSAERGAILKIAATPPQSDGTKLFWDFEQMAADLSRGSAEILDEKRRLLQSINHAFNLYRNRYNMLVGFSTDTPEMPSVPPFIANSGTLSAALSNCVSVGTGTSEICNPSSLVWQKSTFAAASVEFGIATTSGLMTELLRDGKVRFEISPYGASRAEGELLGNFSLWDDANLLTDQPMRLINVIVAIDSAQCGRQVITVRHLGAGIEFRRPTPTESAEPTLIVKQAVQGVLPVHGPAETQLVAAEYDKFRANSMNPGGLEAIMSRDAAAYPFVGYPVIGTYELVADNNLLTCLGTAGSLRIGMIYGKRAVEW